MNLQYVDQLSMDLANEVALIRVDLNIDPAEAPASPRVTKVLPTVRLLLERGARVVFLSSRGRPGGKRSPRLTLRPYASVLQEQLGESVVFISNFHFEEIGHQVRSSGDRLFLLENLRFLPGEEENSDQLAKEVASIGTLYVNDAFANSHRLHMSMDALARRLPAYGGLLLKEEVETLSSVMRAPEHPLVVVSGGAKVSSKVGLIQTFLDVAEHFLIGGAMANTFLKAQGEDIGDSLYEEGALKQAEALIETGKMIVPMDTAKDDDGHILDIGPETSELFARHIREAKTIIWNGPMGYIEREPFDAGTRKLIRDIAAADARSIVGGGETVELIEEMGLEESFSFVSTGGGAMLDFLSDGTVPALDALMRP